MAVGIVASDVVISGGGQANDVAIVIRNIGAPNESLRVSSPCQVSAGTGFSQSGSNAAEILTSNIPGNAIRLDLGAGDDVVTFGNGSLDRFTWNIAIAGGDGTERVVFNDSNEADSNSYILTKDALKRSGLSPIGLAAVEFVEIRAGSGDDDLTVDMSAGLTGFDIAFHGGGQATTSGDVLNVMGDGTYSSSYLPSGSTFGSGTVTVENRRIDFTGLEPVSVSAMFEHTVVTPNSNDAITVSASGGAVVVGGTSGAVPIETVSINSTPHIKLDTGSNEGPLAFSNDVVNFNLPSDLPGSVASFTVETGPGNDTVHVPTTVSLGMTLIGGEGNDTLTGGNGPDIIDGASGRDVLNGNGGRDVLLGGDDEDSLDGGSGGDVLEGGGGNDVLNGGIGDDLVSGGSGDDTIAGGIGSDEVSGGEGTDRFTFVGTPDDDSLTVSASDESVVVTLAGTANDATLLGIESLTIDTDDSVAATTFDDVTLNPLLGTDLQVVNVDGQAFDFNYDRLVIHGSEAAEDITIGFAPLTGALHILGAGPIIYASNFFLDFEYDGDTIEIHGGGGSDTIAVDPLIALDAVYRFFGDGGDDTLVGGGGYDTLNGGAGDDVLIGGGSIDAINGGDGADTVLVRGTESADTLSATILSGFLRTVDRYGTTDYSNIAAASVELVLVEAGAGLDDISISTMGDIGVVVDGGQPGNAIPGDSLTFNGAGTSLSYVSGDEVGQGVFAVGTDQPVSFSGIDELAVTRTGELRLLGTNGPDNFSLFGTSANSLDFSLNDQPSVAYAGVRLVSLEGDDGDDIFGLELNGLVPQSISVLGGGSATDQDAVRLAGTRGDDDNPQWAPSAPNAGLVQLADGATVILTDIEMFYYDGEGDADYVRVLGTGANETFAYRPGGDMDSGRVQIDSLLPIDFNNVSGRVTLGGKGGTNDVAQIIGTEHEDFVVVSDDSSVQITTVAGSYVPVFSEGVETLVLEGHEGTDQFVLLGPLPYLRTLISGGTSATDSAAVFGDGLSGIDVRLDTSGSALISGGGLGEVTTTDIEFANVDASQQDVTITTTGLDDVLRIEPLSPTGGQAELDNAIPILNYTQANSATVDLGDGNDELRFRGSYAADEITLTTSEVTVTGRLGVTYHVPDIEAMVIESGLGDDTLTVNVDSPIYASNLVTVPITFDGGDNSDTLIVSGTPFSGSSVATYSPGQTASEGRLVHVDADEPAIRMTIDFVNLEPVIDLVPGTLMVAGTKTVNSITCGVGPNSGTAMVGGAATGLISVDAFESIEFANKTDVTIDGLAGNDTISVAGRSSGFTGTLFVKGNEPTDADRLIVNGVDATVAVDVDSGRIIGAGPALIDYGTIESLHVNAGDSNELDFYGSKDYSILPGPASDQGTVLTPDLPVSFDDYEAGDTISFVGTAAADDQILLAGSEASDTLTASFPTQNSALVDLASSSGSFATWNVSAVENYVFDGREGDDDINLTATVNVSGTVQVFGGGPGNGGDTLNLTGVAGAISETVVIAPDAVQSDDQTVKGLSPSPIEVTGIAFITYAGVNADDTLTVDPGSGDNAVRIERGTNGDWVVSDSLPLIEFTGLKTFAVDAVVSSGADVVTFATRSLGGALPANYEVAGGATDTLVIEGADGTTDLYTAKNPADTPSVAVSDGTVTVTETAGTLGRLQINTLGGNDQLDVDNSTGLITLPSGIGFDGGTGSDLLRLLGSTVVTDSTYHVGPQADAGWVVHTKGDAKQTVFFHALEPVIDIVAGPLTVNATDADNAIDYRLGPNDGKDLVGKANSGLVSIDGFEDLEFAKKTTLTINALAGSDVVHLNNGTSKPTGLTGIFVNGGDPTASDSLIVNGLAAEAVAVNHTGADNGTIDGAEPVTVTFETLEHLTVNARTSTRLAVSGSTTYTVNPGAETDQGEVLSTGVPIAFDGYGSGEFVQLTGAGAGSEVAVNGTAANDVFTVAVVNDFDTVTITGRATIETDALPTATLNAYAGEDRFVVDGNAAFEYTTLNLNGGDGDNDDSADLNSATGDVVVDLGNATVTGYGITAINYTGLRTVDADANKKLLTVEGSSGDDQTVVTPDTVADGVAARGVVTNNGVNPVVLYSNVPAATGVIVDQLTGGEDTLIVNATSGADTIAVDVSDDAPFVDTGTLGGRVQFDSDTEAVEVHGLAGSDTFNVTSSATIPILMDGGEPVGVQPGDRLNLLAGSTSVFHVGPTPDAGGFVLDGNAPVSFTRIESITVDDNVGADDLSVTVYGTNADDDITMQGTAAGAYTVSVNAGPAVQYTGATTLSLQGQSGDDDFDVDVQVAALGVTIMVDGDLGVAGGGDELTVTGVDGSDDTPVWAPGAADGGTLTLAGITVKVQETESFVYDGESDNETLTVNGTAGDDTITHTPGDAIDAGLVGVNSLLGIRYVALGPDGTVTAAGNGQTTGDTLVALGTDGSDVIEATFAGSNAIDVDVTSAAGVHVDLLSTGVEHYELRGGLGDDDIRLVPTGDVKPLIWASGSFHVYGDGDGTRDTLRINGAKVKEEVNIAPDTEDPDDQDIAGLGTRIDVTGIELIRYQGATTDDTLTVNPGSGDNSVRVEAAHPAPWDLVTSDSLPPIEFTGLKTFAVDAVAGGGADIVTFATRALGGAEPGNYEVAGGATDTLAIEGADGTTDLYTAKNPADTPSVAVWDGTVTVTETAGTLGRLQVNTLGGDDRLDVDNSTGLITLPAGIGFDGGVGNDRLRLLGSTVVTASTYNVGLQPDAGWVVHTAGAGTQTVFFNALEPVIDIVAGPLTVNATDAENAIDYRLGPHDGGALVGGADSGLVSIDGFEDLEFANKTTLTINALAGDDVVNLNNPDKPTELTSIIVNGNDGDDRLTTLSGTPVDVAMYGGAGHDALDASGLTGTAVATLDGGAGNDALVGGPNNDTLRGGSGEDTIISGDGADRVDGGTEFDTLVVPGTPGNNQIHVFQRAPSAVVDAGYELQVSLDGNDLGNDVIAQTAAGVAPWDAGSAPTVEEVWIEAGRGNDLIQVGHADAYADGDPGNGLPGQMLRIAVLGGDPNASDRLVVRDDGLGDLVLIRQAPDERSGRVTVAPDVNTALGDVVYEQIERLDIAPHNPVTGGTGTDGLGRIVVFQPDPFEFNEDRLVPTDIQDVLSQQRDATIDPGGVTDPFGTGDIPGDEDWYEFRSPKIGTFRFDVLFTEIDTVGNGRQGLPGDGALDIAVYDAAGSLIVVGTPTAGGQQATISAAAGTNYYLRVHGAAAPAINTYDVRLTEVDLVGPQLYDPDGAGPLATIHITNNLATVPNEAEYDLFDPKPSAGPTPRIDSLTLHLRDLVAVDQWGRAPGDVYPALDALVASEDGRFSLVGDHEGRIPIKSIAVTNGSTAALAATVAAGGTAGVFAATGPLSNVDGFYNGWLVQIAPTATSPLAGQARLVTGYDGASQTFTLAGGFTAAPAAGDPLLVFPLVTASVRLDFYEPLPDDRYTLTVFDTLRDPAGNLLDGENNAAEPQEDPGYPTGDGMAGMDFVARFTVDSRPEVGTICCGAIYVDINGNFAFDPEGQDGDYTNEDLVLLLGESTDARFAGNFAAAGAAAASGFDKLGAYGLVAGAYRFLLDLDHDGVFDVTTVSGLQLPALPVAGNFAAGHPGDEIGLFDGDLNHRWYLDSDGDNVLELTDAAILTEQAGLPVVGDVNGDGQDDLVTFDVNTNEWTFDLNRNGTIDDRLTFGFTGYTERPLLGDMNLDGVDDLVLWVPGRQGQPLKEIAEWYFLVSDAAGGAGVLPSAIFQAYSPEPLGNDLFAQYGEDPALPILGNFDPPTAGSQVSLAGHTNPENHLDVNGDGLVTALDVLLLINDQNTNGNRPLELRVANVAPFLDPSGDLWATPEDVLDVINGLNSATGAAGGEGEGGSTKVEVPSGDRLLGARAEPTGGVAFRAGVRSAESGAALGSRVLGGSRENVTARWTADARSAGLVGRFATALRRDAIDFADGSLLQPGLEDILAELTADARDAWWPGG